MDLETITVNGTSQTQRLDQETQYVDSRKKHREKEEKGGEREGGRRRRRKECVLGTLHIF